MDRTRNTSQYIKYVNHHFVNVQKSTINKVKEVKANYIRNKIITKWT